MLRAQHSSSTTMVITLHWSSFPDVVEVQRSDHHQELVIVQADAGEHCGVSPAGNLLVGSYWSKLHAR